MAAVAPTIMVSPIEIEGLKVSNSSIYGRASKNAWSRAMAEIYGLFSGRDGRVRYIGQTRGCCSDRFEQHKRSPSPKLRKWFHDEWRAGYPIEYVMLQPCDDELRFEAERHWMTGFSGLLNERMSGQIWLTAMCRTCHPKVPEIKAYLRRYICNAGGFRGVRYDRHWDCYQVLMYTGSGVEWLFGDECDEMIPGWGGNMWFPDRTAAVIARDKARASQRQAWQRQPYVKPYVKWPPDVELEI